MPDLATGAVVFVTGGASGIGRAAAQQFSVEGAAHVVVADLDIDGAEDTVASLAGPGSSIELDVTDDTAVAAAIDGFHDLHEQLYTFAQRDTPVEIVTLHVAAVSTLLQPSLSELPLGGKLEDAKIDRHSVHLDGVARPVPVYDRAKLSPDLVIAGPALVVQLDSTTLIAPDQTAKVDRYGNLLITFQHD